MNSNWEKRIEGINLPIGTVCTIEATSKKVMIVSILPYNKEENKIYDYCACPYPFGLFATDFLILFNSDKIVSVDHYGYKTEDDVTFKKQVFEALKSLKELNDDISTSEIGVAITDSNNVNDTVDADDIALKMYGEPHEGNNENVNQSDSDNIFGSEVVNDNDF